MGNFNCDMIITDLDGTLFNNKRQVSLKDMKALYWLGENNIVRVIATGRNFLSASRALKDSFPIDYLIFSTGAGVYDWKKKELIHSWHMPDVEVKQIAEILINHEIDFMIHEMIPENHKFVYYRSGKTNSDFERRIQIYSEFAVELAPGDENYRHACQIVAVLPNDLSLFEEISNKFNDIKIIRTTSPLDGDSLWMEIFPITVSKGHGIDWLCNKLNINPGNTISIGNDYNDIDMLEFTTEKYVVSNAPEELRKKFPVCNSNQESGFSDAISRHLHVGF